MPIKNLMNAKSLSMISVILLMALMLTSIMQAANAVAVPNRKTGAYISVAPVLIGVGQPLTVNLWVFPAPSGPSFHGQEVPRLGYHNITVTFTRPDGSKDTFTPTDPSVLDDSGKTIPGMTESVGNMYFYYTPNQAGDWSVMFSFPGETFTTPPSDDTVYYEPSTSPPFTFIVQQDKVTESGLLTGWPFSPLPTGYWTRPVNINNREWSAISGNWVQTGYNAYGTKFNPYTTAPNTAHILWETQLTMGGIIGGEWGSISYAGGGGGPGIILDGKVYYNDYKGGTFSCRDLRTGELLYRASGSISFARHLIQSFGWGGVTGSVAGANVAPALWSIGGITPIRADPVVADSSATWRRYDPLTGAVLHTITNAPTGITAVFNEEGSTAFYLFQRWGWNTTITNRYAGIYLIKWDYAKGLWGIDPNSYATILSNNWRDGIVWNVTLRQADGTAPSDGRRAGSTMAFDAQGVVVAYCSVGEDKLYGYDMATGAQLWATDIGFINMNVISMPSQGLIAFQDSATSTYVAFNVKTGQKAWTSDPIGEYPWGSDYPITAADSNTIYAYSTDGHAYAVDMATGKIKWKSNSIGNTTETIYNTWPSFNVLSNAFGGGTTANIAVADGKLYFSTGISWGTEPYIRFHHLWVLDADTGDFLWNVTGAFMINAISDGYLWGTDTLNGMGYTFGKGQTATTVSAPQTAVPKGTSVLISGTVMDQSPAQPNTPAVADESMSEWMEYLHMQNATLINSPPTPKGVSVLLYAIDPNGNYEEIGTVTSDSNGLFKKLWTPEIEGEYTVYATFKGSESYWTSSGVAALGVVKAPATSEGTGTEQPAATPDYTLMFAGLFVAIIILAILVVYLIVRKK